VATAEVLIASWLCTAHFSAVDSDLHVVFDVAGWALQRIAALDLQIWILSVGLHAERVHSATPGRERRRWLWPL